jgi:septal ring-binding cell division protein DamX
VALGYRRPPSWKLPVAIVAVIGALALAGAVVAYDAIDDDARQEVSQTPPKPKQAKAPASGAPKKDARLVKRGDLYSWPRSLEAYTVVLLSVEDRQRATSFANEVADRNDAKTGVISASDFQSLPQGFFIVFGGVYETRERAEQAVERLSARYPSSFAQLVTR